MGILPFRRHEFTIELCISNSKFNNHAANIKLYLIWNLPFRYWELMSITLSLRTRAFTITKSFECYIKRKEIPPSPTLNWDDSKNQQQQQHTKFQWIKKAYSMENMCHTNAVGLVFALLCFDVNMYDLKFCVSISHWRRRYGNTMYVHTVCVYILNPKAHTTLWHS